MACTGGGGIVERPTPLPDTPSPSEGTSSFTSIISSCFVAPSKQLPPLLSAVPLRAEDVDEVACTDEVAVVVTTVDEDDFCDAAVSLLDENCGVFSLGLLEDVTEDADDLLPSSEPPLLLPLLVNDESAEELFLLFEAAGAELPPALLLVELFVLFVVSVSDGSISIASLSSEIVLNFWLKRFLNI